VAKRKSRHSYSQDEINRMLVAFALEGLEVVRLKGGDPFLFGRGGEELSASISEIARQVAESTSITQRAVSPAPRLKRSKL